MERGLLDGLRRIPPIFTKTTAEIRILWLEMTTKYQKYPYLTKMEASMKEWLYRMGDNFRISEKFPQVYPIQLSKKIYLNGFYFKPKSISLLNAK